MTFAKISGAGSYVTDSIASIRQTLQEHKLIAVITTAAIAAFAVSNRESLAQGVSGLVGTVANEELANKIVSVITNSNFVIPAAAGFLVLLYLVPARNASAANAKVAELQAKFDAIDYDLALADTQRKAEYEQYKDNSAVDSAAKKIAAGKKSFDEAVEAIRNAETQQAGKTQASSDRSTNKFAKKLSGAFGGVRSTAKKADDTAVAAEGVAGAVDGLAAAAKG